MAYCLTYRELVGGQERFSPLLYEKTGADLQHADYAGAAGAESKGVLLVGVAAGS